MNLLKIFNVFEVAKKPLELNPIGSVEKAQL
jgi:hypothetical protein